MGNPGPRLRRAARIAARVGLVVAGVLVVVAVLVGVLAPRVLRGERLGRLVEHYLPSTCGEIHVGGGRWTWGTAWALLWQRPAPVWLDDVVIKDPEGMEVLRAHRASGAVELGRKPWRIIIHDVVVEDAAWRLAQMRLRGDIGFLAAFATGTRGVGNCIGQRPPPPPPGTRPRPSSPTPEFRFTGVRFDGLEAVLEFPDWGLVLHDAHGAGHLTYPSAGNPFTFEVTGVEVRGGGRLRVLGERQHLALPFTRAALPRVATTAKAPDDISLAVSGVTVGRSTVSGSGAIVAVYGVSRPHLPTGIVLDAEIADAADALRTVAAGLAEANGLGPLRELVLGGAGAAVNLRFAGPFSTMTIDAEARGIDARFHSADARDLGFRLHADPAAGSIRLSKASLASPGGGRLRLDSEVARLRARGSVGFDGFVVSPLLPRALTPLVGGTIDGTARLELDLRTASAWFDDADVTLTRPPGAFGPREIHLGPSATRGARGRAPRGARAEFVDGTLNLPEVTAPLWGGQLSARGRINLWNRSPGGGGGWTFSPSIDLLLASRRVQLEHLAGAQLIAGPVSLRARVRGSPEDLDFQVGGARGQMVRVFGERFEVPPRLGFHFDGQRLLIPGVALRGEYGGELGVAGWIDTGPRMDLEAAIRAFPLARVLVMAKAPLPFGGKIDGQLHLSGDASLPEVAGQLTLVDGSYRGQPIGGGRLAISAHPGEAIHARGQLIDGVMLDGALQPRGKAPSGSGSLTMQALRLDPFLPPLPGGLRGGGTLSGTVSARLGAAGPPSVKARITDLALSLGRSSASASASATASRELAWRSEGEIRLEAEGTLLRLSRTRLVGDTGTLEVAGESRPGAATGTLRARIDLAPLAAFAGTSALERASGVLTVAVDASTDPAAGKPALTGDITVASPLVVRPRAVPIDVRVPAGHIKVAGDRLDVGIPIALGDRTVNLTGAVIAPLLATRARLDLDLVGELDAGLIATLVPDGVRSVAGSAALRAHIGGTPASPDVSARLGLGEIDVDIPQLGRDRLRIAGGEIAFDNTGVAVQGVTVSVGQKARVTVGGAPGRPASVRVTSLSPLQLARVDVPVAGSISALELPVFKVDDARFALRLQGDPRDRHVLSGDVDILRARFRPSERKAASAAGGSGTAGTSLLKRPEIGTTALDVHVTSRPGAVAVEVPFIDPNVTVDLHVRGTVGKPAFAARVRSSDAYSSLALLVYHLFLR